MPDQYSRTRLLLGEEAVQKLKSSRVAVFGIGGVGGYVVEALARAGVGQLDLIDSDTVSVTNINRQIVALHSTVGQYKVDVAKARVLDIQPDCNVNTYKTFYLPETESEFDLSQYQYVVDAIDTVKGKIALICNARAAGVPVISCMGAGNKLDPTKFKVTDISKTYMDPLAKVMRLELKKRHVSKVKVVWSDEQPVAVKADLSDPDTVPGNGKRAVPGSVSFVPSAAGLVLAGQVVRDLLEI